MAVLLAAAVVLLAGRLVQIQGFQHDEFIRRAARMQTWEEPVPARPGEIVDRRGRVLAASTPALSLFVDPQQVGDFDELAARLASALQLDAAELAARLRALQSRRFAWIKRRLTDAEADRVRALALPSTVAGFRTEFRRTYPQGAVAAHVLGLRDIDNRGRGGLEEMCDRRLAGTPGLRRLRRDARGFVLELLDAQAIPPRDGERIVTTLDSQVQRHVEQSLDRAVVDWRPKSCCAIVMAPATAEILALASRPAFDPAAPESAPADGWSNRAVAAMFEPGSTVKPLVAAWAIDRGCLQPDDVINCEGGQYRMGPRLLHDHHRYGPLSVTDVLVKSSNIGMAKIGERLGNAALYDCCASFGFGRVTGLGLPGELPGLLRPLAEWNRYSTGSIPMGQELAVTPLQLITAHAALANGGRLIAPRLLRGAAVGDEPGPATSPDLTPIVTAAPVATLETARWIVNGPMRDTVRRGTGQKAHLPDWSVFGKTGTAQVVDASAGGYSHERHICSFVGGAPAEDPQVLVLVVVEEPAGGTGLTGGAVAAPIARDILAAVLEELPRLAR